MINKETLAAELYTKYCEAVGGKNFQGDPLPSAEEFFADETKKKQADAWIEIAKRAMEILAS